MGWWAGAAIAKMQNEEPRRDDRRFARQGECRSFGRRYKSVKTEVVSRCCLYVHVYVHRYLYLKL